MFTEPKHVIFYTVLNNYLSEKYFSDRFMRFKTNAIILF